MGRSRAATETPVALSQMAVAVQAGLALSASRLKTATPLPSRRRRRTRSGPGERALQLNFNNGGGLSDQTYFNLNGPLDGKHWMATKKDTQDRKVTLDPSICAGAEEVHAFPETRQASRAGVGRSSVGWRQPRTEAGPLRHFCE
jgi:hypothetical protein